MPEETKVGEGGSGPRQVDLAEVHGKVDFGIVTILEDEFRALLYHFPVESRAKGRRWYSLSRLSLLGGGNYLIAMVRCAEQGGGEAQAAAHDLLDEVKPRWLLVVGIAGGKPSSDFGLGDVIVSTRVYDFRVEAVLQDGEREYSLAGGPLHPEARAIASDLPAREQEMQGWNSPDFVRAPRPSIDITDDRLEGSPDWRRKVKDSLSKHIGRNLPLVTACPVASSDRLVRHDELLRMWLKIARQVCAVEMESAGIYTATHGLQIPFLAIRGISDVVGFKRDDAWKAYACASAAAFTRAFLGMRPLPPRGPDPHHSGSETTGHGDKIPSLPVFYRVADYIPGHKFVGRTHELEQIDEWSLDLTPLLLFTSIGGMGKSMLTWHWVTDCALKARRDWAGIFWYSFYERGADMREFCAHALAYTTGGSLSEFRQQKTAALIPKLTSVLHQKPWLFVLDGLERILVAYHRFDAAEMRDDDVESDPDSSSRPPQACVHPVDDELIRAFCGATPSKLLISSRLTPKALMNSSGEILPGARQIELRGLDSGDAENLIRELDICGDSTRMRTYLQKHFACHPLVVGVVGGLVANFLPAPRNFDVWAEHPQGGSELRFASMNLVQRQNHILKVALSDLKPESRILLGRLSLISEAVDLEALQALNPLRTFPPEKVYRAQTPFGSGWLRVGSVFSRAKKDYDKYLRAMEAWKRSESVANTRLKGIIKDLEIRGLVQWDRQHNVFDLHPVVRGCAVDMLSADERLANGQKVVDYFSSRSRLPYERVSSFEHLGNAIQIVRTYFLMRRYQDAADALDDGLCTALGYTLERFDEVLVLLRPFFPDGWEQPPRPLRLVSQSAYFSTIAANAFHRMSYIKRALSVRRHAISIALTGLEIDNLIVNIFNEVSNLEADRRFYQARCALMLASELVEFGKAEHKSAVSLHRAWRYWKSGNLEAAEASLREFRTSERDASAAHRVEAERLTAWIRFDQGSLQEDFLSSVMQRAQNVKERFDLRELYDLKGQWLLSRSLLSDAQHAFEEAIRMSREVGLSSAGPESHLARLHAKQQNTALSLEIAGRIEDLALEIDLAELYLALNDHPKALKYAVIAYNAAWADGMPYCHGRDLNRCREVLKAVGHPEPQLPPFDESKAEALPYEVKVRALIGELKKKRWGRH